MLNNQHREPIDQRNQCQRSLRRSGWESHCSKRTFKRRDIDRTTSGSYHRDELLEEERLEGTLSQIPEFRHYFFCSGLSDSTQCGSIV